MSGPAAGAPEFSRIVDTRSLGNEALRLEADEGERRALAQRFGIVGIDALTATVELEPVKAGIAAGGRLEARIVQACAISGEDLPVTISEALSLRFVPARGPGRPDEELELDAGDLDEIEFTGTQFDLGEAVAQSLALAIDPFLEGPNAEEFRKNSGYFGEERENPFAALAKLKKQ
uniref:DNA-binding protein n=1 Tax=uncultured bacterium 5H7 TaxID=1701327 RepID=A0A0N9HTL4_9BACT|nr:hypothetical protein 5H7_034 [uncultured bacterium 5H7]